MSPRSTNTDENSSVTKTVFRGVYGNRIYLGEEFAGVKNNHRVVQFEIKNGERIAGFGIFVVLLSAIILWEFDGHVGNFATTFGALLGGLALLKIWGIISTVRTDTLLVVESVGIQIICKRLLSCLESSTFLPWNTVKDVFINEVITGHRVLYYLTFIIRDSSGGKDSTKLVPLFRDLKP